jgi:streptogramin lyase
MGCRSSLSAALAVVAALTLAAGARADIVATLPPGSYFTDVSVAATGAVWVASSGPTRTRSAIGTVVPGGGVSWTSLPIIAAPQGGTSHNAVFARPDGGVWAFLGGRVAVRSTPTGLARTDVFGPGEYESRGFASAFADGGALVAPGGDRSFVRVGLDGARTTVRYTAPGARGGGGCIIDFFGPAPDGTLVVDDGCDRLLRLRADGSVVETTPLTGALGDYTSLPRVLTAPAGDEWIANDSRMVHRVGGVVSKVVLPDFDGFLGPWGMAPDGSVWVAESQGCDLLHITAAGVQRVPTPITAEALAVAPDGTVWLTSRGRLAHVGPAGESGRCDQRQPTVRLTDVKRGTVSIAALRRRHGLRVTSSEPGTMIGDVTVAGVEVKPQQAVDRRGTTLRFSPKLLRRIARSGRIEVRYLQVWDANGNGGGPRAAYVRVRR